MITKPATKRRHKFGRSFVYVVFFSCVCFCFSLSSLHGRRQLYSVAFNLMNFWLSLSLCLSNKRTNNKNRPQIIILIRIYICSGDKIQFNCVTHLFNNSLKTKMKNDGSGMWNRIEWNETKTSFLMGWWWSLKSNITYFDFDLIIGFTYSHLL